MFDHPTPAAVASHLLGMVIPETGASGDNGTSSDAEIRSALASISLSRLREAGLLDELVRLAKSDDDDASPDIPDGDDSGLDEMDADALVRMTFDEGTPAEPEAGG